jgi:hypothetical protein
MLQGGDERSINTLVNDYIMEYSEKKTANQTERIIKNIIRNDPERAWEIILALIEAAPDEKFLVDIGVGILENLLAYHAEKFIDRIEIEANRNVKFIEALESVWRRRDISDEIWRRIQRAIQEQWKDDIIIMQKLFRDNNFDLGEENGVIGLKTQEAIDQLRIKTGMHIESIEEIIEQLRTIEK